MANIDRADWHSGGNFPADLPQESGGTHIGMYLAWAVVNGLASAYAVELLGNRVEELRGRRITGRDILFEVLDGKFFDRLLTVPGQDFTRAYYESDLYAADYDATLADGLPTLYHVHDTWGNFDRLAPVIAERFAQWHAGDLPTRPSSAPHADDPLARYMAAVSEAAAKLKESPAEAAACVERYAASEPDPVYRDKALRELAVIRKKHLQP